MSEISIEKEYVGWREGSAITGLSEASLRRLVREGRLRQYRPMKRRSLLRIAELRQLMQDSMVGVGN
jgi:predicted DNA-binding transcriptional regulator AlpA